MAIATVTRTRQLTDGRTETTVEKQERDPSGRIIRVISKTKVIKSVVPPTSNFASPATVTRPHPNHQHRPQQQPRPQQPRPQQPRPQQSHPNQQYRPQQQPIPQQPRPQQYRPQQHLPQPLRPQQPQPQQHPAGHQPHPHHTSVPSSQNHTFPPPAVSTAAANGGEEENLTFVLPALAKWTNKDENVPLELTGGKIMPAFIPLGQQPEGYLPGGKELMKEYVCATEEGWYHVSTKEAWFLLWQVAMAASKRQLACVRVMNQIPILFPFSFWLLYRNRRIQKYIKLTLRRSESETPGGIPHKHPQKYEKYYTNEGHWILPHKLRKILRR